MSKVVGIDLGTTNTSSPTSRTACRSSSATSSGDGLVPSVVSVGRGRHDLRRPRSAAPAADRRAAHRLFGEALHGQGASTTCSDEARACSRSASAAKRAASCASALGDARVHAAGDFRVRPARAEAPRRGVLRRAGRVRQRSRSRGDHGAGVLQRRAAHRDARRRPHRRPRGAAHHQRADRGVAGLRPRQAAHAASSPSTTSAAARSTSRSSASRTASSRCSSTNGDTHLGGDDIDVLLIDTRARPSMVARQRCRRMPDRRGRCRRSARRSSRRRWDLSERDETEIASSCRLQRLQRASRAPSSRR